MLSNANTVQKCYYIVSLFLQAASAETAESKGSPGFFSQVLSELAAPLYEDDEQDFLSEDNDSENPSTEDENGKEEVEDALHESFKGKGKRSDFVYKQKWHRKKLRTVAIC